MQNRQARQKGDTEYVHIPLASYCSKRVFTVSEVSESTQNKPFSTLLNSDNVRVTLSLRGCCKDPENFFYKSKNEIKGEKRSGVPKGERSLASLSVFYTFF